MSYGFLVTVPSAGEVLHGNTATQAMALLKRDLDSGRVVLPVGAFVEIEIHKEKQTLTVQYPESKGAVSGIFAAIDRAQSALQRNGDTFYAIALRRVGSVLRQVTEGV